MAYDEETADRVRRVLAAQRDVTELRMMGGLCFMVGGNMCCGVSKDRLMVRVGPEAYGPMLTQPHVRPMEFGGRRPKAFVYVDTAGYRTDAALAAWVRRGIDFVTTLSAKKTTKRKSG